MDRPRRGWWGYVKWVIRDQPEKRRELEAMRSTGGFASDGTPRATEARRTTEDRALRGFTGQKAREYDAVEAAAAETRTYGNGPLRLKFVDLVFWRRSHTLEGAAMVCHISRRTAIRYHGDFIRLVAAKMGFDVEGR
jgi:hypothetical protein